MNFVENIKMAFESIISNRLRSLLTMLGIIIGISSVIAILSLGEGGKSAVTREFEKIGSSTINLRVNGMKAQKSDYLTMDDIKYIREKVEDVKYISPVAQRMGLVSTPMKSRKAVVTGTNPDITYTSGLEIMYGRMFSEREFTEGRPVVVIDEITAGMLFGSKDATGQSLNIGSKGIQKKAIVIGISKSAAAIFGEDEGIPAFVHCPLTFSERLFTSDSAIDTAYITAGSKEDGDEAVSGALNILQSRHNNRGRDIYRAESALKELEQINRVLGIFTAFIGAVAAISLIVGGIGVMNIMLVSVTERTREIGIRKAIGATTTAILLQFLTEAVILSLSGGLVGITVGISGAMLVGEFAGISPVLSMKAIAGTILFSSAVGMFFGIYPARKAASLDPIEALRYE
ncbi:MAG: ABC transporter permease [Bacillota bacterium]|nr:ABC transporter permease [Bacillota bacterium]